MKNIVKKIDFKDKKTVKKLIALIVALVVVTVRNHAGHSRPY